MNDQLSITVLPDGRMDAKNAAIYIGRKPKTLAQWRFLGIGPSYVKRGRIYYYKNDLDNWLCEGKIN